MGLLSIRPIGYPGMSKNTPAFLDIHVFLPKFEYQGWRNSITSTIG